MHLLGERDVFVDELVRRRRGRLLLSVEERARRRMILREHLRASHNGAFGGGCWQVNACD